MSGKVVGMVFDHYPNGGSELLLAVKLADNAHDDGSHIFPAVATLARQTRQSERTVQYQLKRMLGMGWLELVRFEGGGRGKAREYRINPTWIKAHDSRIAPQDRPTWEPLPAETGLVDNPQKGAKIAPFSEPQRVQQLLHPFEQKGAKIAPFSEPERVQPGAQKGAIAVAQKGAIAVAPEPSLTVIEPNTPQPPKGGEGGFEAFYKIFPKQVDEDKARAQWDRIAPDFELQAVIIAAVLDWRNSVQWQKEGGSLVPKPHNWLRNKGWCNVPGIAPLPRKAAPPPEARKAHAPMPADVRAKALSLLGARAARHQSGRQAVAQGEG